MGKIADKLTKHLQGIASRMNGHVDVGFLEGATYPDGTSVASVAFWNNFGTTSAPARPFFSNMIVAEKSTWGGKVAAISKATGQDGPTILAYMGEDIEGSLKASIIALTSPALSPTTLILRKRFGNQPHNITYADVQSARQAARAGEQGATGTQAKPLIWTGHMLASTGYVVKK